MVKWIAMALLAALVLASTISVESVSRVLIASKDEIVARFDWLFVGVASLAMLAVGVFSTVPAANVRLGPVGEEPEFSRFSWFAMLFSAGLASGLLYWAAAEPVLHYQDNPFAARDAIEMRAEDASWSALRITIFHWGFHGWAMYVIGALAIGIYSYRHHQPLAIRTALFPVLGARHIERWPGKLVDLLALLGTVFGVSTSIGLSAAAINSTLSALMGLPMSAAIQIGIVFFVCVVGVASAISGIGRGVRRLSELNMGASSVFLFAIFAAGPTLKLVELLFVSIVDYGVRVIPMGLWIGSTSVERQWQGDWTLFYWGWWLAWMPFVSLFIARISKGRTVREFIVAVMGIPTLMIAVWMVILGGTALELERASPGSISEVVHVDSSLGIASVLDQLGSPGIASALTLLAVFLLLSWLITSLDSATLAITQILGTPDVPRQQAVWGFLLAAVSASLIWVGGLEALQAVSIIIGLPLALVLLLIGAGLVRDLIRGGL